MNSERENGSNSSIPNLKEAHNNLHAALGDKAFAQYNALLKQFFSLRLSRVKFDEEARKLLCTNEQVHLHNVFLLSFSDKVQPGKSRMYMNDEMMDDSENSMKYAVQERCIPDDDLVKTRVLVTAYQNDLDGAEDDVTRLIVLATKLYLKNILTAVISKYSGYKIRDNSFQHAVGFPVADPWLRNYSNIIDDTHESNLEENEEHSNIQPVVRGTLESVQQQTAFAYSCSTSRNRTSHTRISLLSLYEALLEDPSIINNHTIHSINLERILTKLDSVLLN